MMALMDADPVMERRKFGGRKVKPGTVDQLTRRGSAQGALSGTINKHLGPSWDKVIKPIYRSDLGRWLVININVYRHLFAGT